LVNKALKLSQFKSLIREEIKKVLSEDDLSTRVATLNRVASARDAAKPYDTLALISKYLDTNYPEIKYKKTNPVGSGALINIEIKMKPYTAMVQMSLDGKWDAFTTGPGPALQLSRLASKDPKEAFKKIKPWLDTTITNMKAKSY
jgi:hypothetical protein